MADRIAFVESSGWKAFSGKPATPFYTGQIIMSGGVNVPLPAGWLWCDGSLFDVTVYPELATVLNNNFNNGSVPSGFMRLPNFVDTLPTHKSGTVGTIGGSQSHFHGLDTVGYALNNIGAHTHGYNLVNLSHYHNTNGFNSSFGSAHNHGVNGVSTGGPNTRTRRGTNGTEVTPNHTHPVTQSNTAGGGDHSHAANGVSTSYASGNHDHGGASSAGGHTHTVFGAGIIYSSDLTNIPDVVSVNFMIRAL
jgi:microcystin-dependent protein